MGVVCMNYSTNLPSPERLGLGPIWENLAVVCIGAALIFAAAIVLYFLLRGKRQY